MHLPKIEVVINQDTSCIYIMSYATHLFNTALVQGGAECCNVKKIKNKKYPLQNNNNLQTKQAMQKTWSFKQNIQCKLKMVTPFPKKSVNNDYMNYA